MIRNSTAYIPMVVAAAITLLFFSFCVIAKKVTVYTMQKLHRCHNDAVKILYKVLKA